MIEEEIEIQLAFDGNLQVVSGQLGSPSDPISVISEPAFYDFENDPEVAELLSDPSELQKIEITSVTYQIQDYIGTSEAVVIDGGIGIFDNPNAGTVYYMGQQNTNLEQADQQNSVFRIEGDFSEVEDFINLTNRIGLLYQGEVSNNPVEFVIGITVRATVTVKPDIDNF